MKYCAAAAALLLLSTLASAQSAAVSLVDRDRAAQPAPATPGVIAPDAANLAEKYAADREARARAEERDAHNQLRARWLKMARAIGAQLDNVETRLDVIDANIEVVRTRNPRIVQLEAELSSRIDKAEKQARDWADIERTATQLPTTLIDFFTGRGFKIGIESGSQPPPTTTTTTTTQPPQSEPISGEAKGVALTTTVGIAGALTAWWLNRRAKNAAAQFDQRNETVTQTAMAKFFAALRGSGHAPDHAVRIGGDHPPPTPPKRPPPPPTMTMNGAPFADKEPGAMDSAEFNTLMIDLLTQRAGRNGS